jgi:hypothetical protein
MQRSKKDDCDSDDQSANHKSPRQSQEQELYWQTNLQPGDPVAALKVSWAARPAADLVVLTL